MTVLIIPVKTGNSYTLPSVKKAAKMLGVSERNLRRAIREGCSLHNKEEEFFADYELDELDLEPKYAY